MSLSNEDGDKVDTRLLPRLTKAHWTKKYKKAAKCLALDYGEAGEIIPKGKDLQLPKPNRSDYDTYPDNERGDWKFNKDNDRYQRLKNQKKKFMSNLLSTMDNEVFDQVSHDEEYEQIMKEFDVLDEEQCLCIQSLQDF